MDLAARRREYESKGIDVGDLDADPIVQLGRWLEEGVDPATVQVTAQVQGKLLTAYFKEGQLVRKGQQLALKPPAVRCAAPDLLRAAKSRSCR